MTEITRDLMIQIDSLNRPLRSITLGIIRKLDKSLPTAEYEIDTQIFSQSNNSLDSHSSRLKLCGLFNNLGATQFIVPKSDGTIKFLSIFNSWRFSGNIETVYVSFNEELYTYLLEIKESIRDNALIRGCEYESFGKA